MVVTFFFCYKVIVESLLLVHLFHLPYDLILSSSSGYMLKSNCIPQVVIDIRLVLAV